MKKKLAKITSDAITLLPHNITMPTTISKTASLEKSKDLIEILRGDKPHCPHVECKDETLMVLDKLHEIFEPQKRGACRSSNGSSNTIQRNLQNPTSTVNN